MIEAEEEQTGHVGALEAAQGRLARAFVERNAERGEVCECGPKAGGMEHGVRFQRTSVSEDHAAILEPRDVGKGLHATALDEPACTSAGHDCGKAARRRAL